MEYLSRKGIDYVARDVRADSSALRELLDMGYSSTPVITVNGQAIVGFDADAIDRAVAASAVEG
jgi:glutaredoxin-like protein NrdH